MQIIKQYGVWIVLSLTLIATWWVSYHEEIENVVALPKYRSIEASLQVDSDNNVQLVESEPARLSVPDENPQNLFTIFDPPNEQVNAAQEAAPVTPINPYVYAGKIIDGMQITVFLLNGENSYAVKVGDILDEVWKVKAIKPPNLTLRYLPLKTDVQLDIGVVN